MTSIPIELTTKPMVVAAPVDRPPTAPAQFHVLAKPSGPICNLDCEYCFFLSKEALYPGDRFRMSDELLETYIRQLLESQTGTEVTVAWQGGEPTLMGVDFFRRAVALVEQYRRPDQQVQHTIQTNGTLLTDQWCRLFAEHGFLVGISIDGPPAMHDTFRVDKRGNPTSGKVLRGYDLLRRHGVDTNILCTVNAANQDHPVRVYRYFRDELGASFIQLIPIVERDNDTGFQEGDTVTDRSVDPEAWGRFLIGVFDEWVRADVGSVYVQTFDSALASWLGVPGAVCVFAETCGDAVALEHNGDLYSCDHFVEPDVPARQHHHHPHGRTAGVTAAARASATPSGTRCPDTASTARSASRATANAPRTGSRPPPTATTDSTTCVPATRRSSPTSTGSCA